MEKCEVTNVCESHDLIFQLFNLRKKRTEVRTLKPVYLGNCKQNSLVLFQTQHTQQIPVGHRIFVAVHPPGIDTQQLHAPQMGRQIYV